MSSKGILSQMLFLKKCDRNAFKCYIENWNYFASILAAWDLLTKMVDVKNMY